MKRLKDRVFPELGALGAVALLGCGASAAPPNEPDNALLGTWSATMDPGNMLTPEFASFEQDLTFGRDMSLASHTRIVWSSLTPRYPRCVDDYTNSVPQTWDTSAGDGGRYLAINGRQTIVEMRADCVDPFDDAAAGPPAPSNGMPSGPSSNPYVLSDDHDTLTIGTGIHAIVYTRQ